MTATEFRLIQVNAKIMQIDREISHLESLIFRLLMQLPQTFSVSNHEPLEL